MIRLEPENAELDANPVPTDVHGGVALDVRMILSEARHPM
jgi:hypothetical protein